MKGIGAEKVLRSMVFEAVTAWGHAVQLLANFFPCPE